MELSIFDIIKKPVITSKSVELYKKLGQITFEVNTTANKIAVRQAVEKIWNVKVAGVSILNVSGKKKIFGRRPFMSSNKKKAIVTLKKGYKIEIPGMFEAMGVAEVAPGNEIEAEGK
jgi:large subunit ribosomal protein L23